MATKQDIEQNETPAHLRLDPIWRWVISAILMFHLVAIFLPPFGFQTGGSPFIEWLMGAVRWYDDAAFLNHGYAFFAPNPGPSHLVRYTLEFDDGREPLQQTFPDIDRHWPRLLYHRHFMLSEHLTAAYRPFDMTQGLPRPPGLTDEQWDAENNQRKLIAERWEKERRAYVARWESFENHLRARYGAKSVTMERVEHLIPPPAVTEDGINLRDERMYRAVTRDTQFPDPPLWGRQ